MKFIVVNLKFEKSGYFSFLSLSTFHVLFSFSSVFKHSFHTFHTSSFRPFIYLCVGLKDIAIACARKV